jgi:adenosylcobinamide kinase/adenosylcobinamide-phosphate guanylyltransferase
VAATHNVTLVLGGVRSGKSRYAQQLAERAESVLFVATAEVRDDDEMRAKIERHRNDRPAHWTTIEEPIELARIVAGADGSQVVLIDCLTLFAANMIERFGEDATASHPEIDSLCSALAAAPCSVILVSNEVGSGVVPAYALGRQFRDLVGEINQRVAAVADNVFYMVAGLSLVLKGELPR